MTMYTVSIIMDRIKFAPRRSPIAVFMVPGNGKKNQNETVMK